MAAPSAKASARHAIVDAIDLLKDDPRRFKSLLRSAAALVEEASVVLADAGREKESGKVRLLSKSLRAAALLPVAVSAPIARKWVEKYLR